MYRTFHARSTHPSQLSLLFIAEGHHITVYNGHIFNILHLVNVAKEPGSDTHLKKWNNAFFEETENKRNSGMKGKLPVFLPGLLMEQVCQ